MKIKVLDYSMNPQNVDMFCDFVAKFDVEYEYLFTNITTNDFGESDLYLIIGAGSPQKNAVIKNNLAKVFCVNLAPNMELSHAINTYFESVGDRTPINFESENMAFCDAECVTFNSPWQAWRFNNVVYMSHCMHLDSVLNSVVANMIVSGGVCQYDRLTLKAFGIDKSDVITNLLKSVPEYKTSVVEKNMDIYIYIYHNENNVDAILEKVYSTMGKYIYTYEDVSLPKHIISLCKLYHRTLSIVEDGTCGAVSANLAKCVQNTEVLGDCIILSDSDTMLQIDSSIASKYGKFSVQYAYEICASILTKGADLAVATVLGDEHLYVAVGDVDGVHVYKSPITKNVNLDIVANLTYFHLLKKLKQNDLFFSQTVL